MIEDDSYDFFVSYKIEDVLLVRQVVEQLIVSDIKVWFDEYQILVDNYKNWQELVKVGIQKSKKGYIYHIKLLD